MEFHINGQADNAQPNQDSLANDRLRKAIERNRAKQARREGASPRQANPTVGSSSSRIPNDWRSPGTSSGASQRMSQNNSMGAGARTQATTNFEAAQSRFDNMNSRRASSTPSHARRQNVMVGGTPPTPNSSLNRGPAGPSAAASRPQASSMGTRRTVAGLNQEQQIIETPKRKRKAASSVTYSTPKKKNRKSKSSIGSDKIQLLVKGSWIVCLLLFVRLIFTDGGIIDYYSTKSLLKLKNDEALSVKSENENLVDEIDRIKNDRSYQKKLVRDNLGFIAKNEYLVLFPKHKEEIN